MPSLKELRELIDKTDDSIVSLLGERAKLVLEVKSAKERERVDIYSPEREQQIVDRVLALAKGSSFPATSLETIMREIVSATRSLIGEITVEYLGPEHSLAHTAAQKQFGERVRYNPSHSTEELFRKVEQNQTGYGVVPIETASNGIITSTLTAFLQSPLHIIAEIRVAERLDLVGLNFGLSEVQKISADANTYPQSMKWLKANLPGVELVLADNSTSAAQAAANSANTGAKIAAIVPEALSSHYGLRVLASGIGDASSSTARYIVVGHHLPGPTGKDKTSLLCAVSDHAGALCEILRPFQKHKLNLTKIESKPMQSHSLDYAFFIDVDGHMALTEMTAAIEELKGSSSFLKILGSYPKSSS